MTRRLWSIPAWCLLIGAILRLARFPHADSPAQFDELSYLSNGLLVLEGETPINKYAPSGPLTWFSTAYGGIRALFTLIADKTDIAAFPWMLRPAAAMENTLSGLYADMTGLRLAAAAATVMVTLAGIAAACRLGRTLGGAPGQAAAGLLAAALPIFVEMSTEIRPYASAWALGLLALALAGTAKPGTRILSTGIFLGLAVGSHIDMIRIAPVVLLLQWHCRRLEDRSPQWRDYGRILAIALVTFLAVAPWYLPHLADNIRQIFSVRLLGSFAADEGSIWRYWLRAGIAIPLAVTLAGLAWAGLRRNWPAFTSGVWLALNVALALRPSGHGLQHDGALLVMIVALLPLALSALQEDVPSLRKPAVAAILVAIIVGPTLWHGAAVAFAEGRSLTTDDSVAWIETNIPAGTLVYTDAGQFRSPLPTTAAADRLWADVAAPDAWIGKYRHDTTRFGLDGAPPLRVMSTDRLDADRGNRRRYAILGSMLAQTGPRYDLQLVSYGGFFDATPEAALARLCRDGGIYLHYGRSLPGWPPPVMSWIRRDGNSTYIYRIVAGGCAS